MNNYEISVSRGTKGFGLSLIYRGLDKFPAPETGIFVARVVPGGSSHRAGLQENDKVLRINKKAPRDVDEAVNIIKKAGKTLLITVGRKQPDIIQGDTKPAPRLSVVQQPAPLSRSGSVRSINTQFAQSRPQTPDSSEEEDERNQGNFQQIFFKFS
ncbi:discs large homolog 1-like protein [Eurytemora carolleeae]|uniref:discs large homolog 1-like protein n=1 Tax=Eurytemora carolleeae TaxID=1294199 RepID=UPI000C75DD83|nr:discs large homolog 1-like protein [Eurytemora carolleeae]|eukprot:XP_023332393.1 discs large homolog 1-like protein [Eurytemora affinis]